MTTSILCRGGRSGRKVHRSDPDSSCTRCGHWLKAQAKLYAVAEDTPEARERHRAHLCGRCFPSYQEGR